MLNEKDILKARSGDRDAFIRIINDCRLTLYRISKTKLYSDHDCADAIQDTILKAYESIHSLRNARSFKSWIIRILLNECNKLLRSRQKHHYVEQEHIIDFQKTNPNLTLALEIKELLFVLSDELRLPLVLFYLEDIPIKKIAQLLDVSEGTVKSRLYRAREKLITQNLAFEKGERNGE